MAKRPIIGITTQTLAAIPDQLPHCWVMSQRYVLELTAAGAVPWVIPLLHQDPETLRHIYDQLDGVFLPGGVDIDPSTYHEDRLPSCGVADIARDYAELMFTRWATEDRKPILAVCRGIQLVNVAWGGTLYQHLPDQYPSDPKHDCFPVGGRYTRDQRVHDVRVEPSSRLSGILEAEEICVNSMHHQGIKALAPGLVPTAYATDGLIEGVEASDGHFLIGTQWHPEDLSAGDPLMHRLFRSFVEAANEYRAGHA